MSAARSSLTSRVGAWRASRGRSATAVLALVLAVMLTCAPGALAHAQLLGSSPGSGTTVASEPREVIFEFDQAVGGTLGAVRVYDAQGQEVDDLDVSHPGSRRQWLGVGLKRGLPDGTYTATYRVVSADTHIVHGGLVFTLGHPAGMSKLSVAGLIERNQSGRVTELAFGLIRGLDYVSIALLLGGLAFAVFVWWPALAAARGPEQRWSLAARAFAARLSTLAAVAVVLGVLVSLLGVLLQGASAAGVSLWSSLKATVIESTLESRFGEVWGLRALDWVALGLLLVALWARLNPSAAAEQTIGAASAAGAATAPGRRPAPWLLAPLALCAAYLAIAPALAGHASVESPVGVFFASDVLHVLSASVWVGGIACLLFVLPRATRALEGPERSRLLLFTLARFSPLALVGVLVISATGVIQAYIDVRSVHGLLHTTYGALVVAKVVLLVALVAFGANNRRRIIPRLARIVEASGTPGAAGVQARRSLRGELALMGCVFGVTAALISYAPPIDAASGPFSINTTIGPAVLEMTVEPARVGLNTIHLYLFDAKSGAQFAATKELTVTAELPAKQIGPLPLTANVSGPGHYTLNAAELSPGGTWSIRLTDRVSEFEEFTRTVQVPIR